MNDDHDNAATDREMLEKLTKPAKLTYQDLMDVCGYMHFGDRTKDIDRIWRGKTFIRTDLDQSPYPWHNSAERNTVWEAGLNPDDPVSYGYVWEEALNMWLSLDECDDEDKAVGWLLCVRRLGLDEANRQWGTGHNGH